MASMPLYTSLDYDDVYNCGVYTFTGAQNVTVRDCSFVNLYTVGGYFRIADNVIVTDCRFTSPLQTQDQNLQHLQFQTSSAIKVKNCDFDNAPNTSPATNACGIFASGITKFMTVDNCTFNYCGRDNTGTHRLGVIDFYYDVDNVTVTNCVSKNTMAEFMRLSTCVNGVISNNQIHLNANCETGANILSTQSGAAFIPTANTNCRNITIANNVFNNEASANVELAIGVFAYDWGALSENIVIVNNTSSNIKRMVTVLGPFNGVKIIGNQSVSVAGSVSGTINAAHMPAIQSNYGTEANSYFTGLQIANNTISSLGENGFIDLNYSSITTTAHMGEFDISGNIIDATTTLSSNIGISVDLRSSDASKTQLSVEQNFVRRYNYAFQLNNSGNVVLANNKSQNNTNYLIQSGNASFNAYGNITRGGALFGRAKLSSGSVTVSGSDCNSGDNIMVTHYDNSGVTLGILYVSNVASGVFDINSTSATDDANVIWHVIH